MTEFELVSAMQGYANYGTGLLMDFFSILTAYLAAGYLAAHRLTRAMASFVTAIFLVLSILFVLAFYRTFVLQIDLGGEMVNFAKVGKGLAWHPVSLASTAGVTHFGYVFMATLLTIVISAIVGGVYFFYDCRKRNMQATA